MTENKTTARGAQARGRRGSSTERSNRETVTAADIQIGDKVFFPSSRHAASVGSVVEETGADERTIRRIQNEDGSTSWVMPMDAPVDREVQE